MSLSPLTALTACIFCKTCRYRLIGRSFLLTSRNYFLNVFEFLRGNPSIVITIVLEMLH